MNYRPVDADPTKRAVGSKGCSRRQHLYAFAYIEDYDLELAKVMTAGVDVWLNTPQPPLEASGTTSGMKAALNGVPSLQRLGWLVDRRTH